MSLVVAIRTPVPKAPLPKGGWHGKAETGRFLSRTHGRAHGPCPTKVLVGWHARVSPPHRTSCNPPVGRAALSPPPSHAALRQGARALLCKAFPCTSGPHVPRRAPLSACKSYAPTEKNLPVRGKGDESGCRYSGENAIAVRKGLPYHSKAGKPRAPAA